MHIIQNILRIYIKNNWELILKTKNYEINIEKFVFNINGTIIHFEFCYSFKQKT